MPSQELWPSFVGKCAHMLMAGQMTSQYLRQAIEDPKIRSQAANDNFRALVVEHCERIQPGASRIHALMLEIDATTKRLERLLESSRRGEAELASSWTLRQSSEAQRLSLG